MTLKNLSLALCVVSLFLISVGCIDIPSFIGINATVAVNPSKETIDALNDAIRALDQQPEKWQQTGDALIGKLGDTQNEVVKKTVNEVKSATAEIIGLTAGELQCRLDSQGNRFKTYLRIIRYDLETDYHLPHIEKERPILDPIICSFSIDGSESSLTYIDKTSKFVKYYGYDFANYAKKKEFHLVVIYGDNGELIKELKGSVSTPHNYQLECDLQAINFQNDPDFWNNLNPKRSPKLILKWGDKKIEYSSDSPGSFSEIPIYVEKAPKALFDAAPTSGTAPLTVNFKDRSENALQWNWDFGNGQKSQNTPEKDVTYTNPGKYLVILKVNNLDGLDEANAYIVVNEPSPPPPITPKVREIIGQDMDCATMCALKGLVPISPGYWESTDNNNPKFYYCSFYVEGGGVRPGYNYERNGLCTIGYGTNRVQSSKFNCLCAERNADLKQVICTSGNCQHACENAGGYSAIAPNDKGPLHYYYCAFDVHYEGVRPGYNWIEKGICSSEYNNNEESNPTFDCPCYKKS